MSERARQLAQKRMELTVRSAVEREQLLRVTQDVERRLRTVDRVIEGASLVIRNPVAWIAIAAGVVIVGPWRLLKWATQATLVFRIASRARGWFGRERKD